LKLLFARAAKLYCRGCGNWVRRDTPDSIVNELLTRGVNGANAVIEGTGGLRKIQYRDSRRSKGKRGGLRVIYYWWLNGSQFWYSPFMTKMRLPI